MSNPQVNPQWRTETGAAPLLAEALDVYMIIEPELWPDWQAQLYQTTSEPFYSPLFEQTQFANIELGPVLIALSEQQLFASAIDKMQSTPCGCLLFVQQGTSQASLLDILRERLVVLTGQSTALLRYYEPRTLLPLLGTMQDEERSLFFQHIEQIHWYHGQWHWVSIDQPIHPPKQYQWTITPQHISTMQSILNASSGAV
jgi:hypothetical protein